MLAKEDYARSPQSVIERKLGDIEPTRRHWKAGDIHILDNWTVLHGRESCNRKGSRQVIYRSGVVAYL